MKFRSDLPDTGNKNYLKLKDKESVSGIFRGDLHEFFILWTDGKSREVPEDTPDAKFRFRVNFVVKDGPTYVPKIFEQGAKVYAQLAELNDEYELEKTVVKITRNGTGTDTTYSVLPLIKQEVTKQTLEHLATLPLLPLSSTKDFSETSDIPF